MTGAVLFAVANSWAYITAAYLVVFATLGLYALTVIVRGRKVGRQLPPDERRWLK